MEDGDHLIGDPADSPGPAWIHAASSAITRRHRVQRVRGAPEVGSCVGMEPGTLLWRLPRRGRWPRRQPYPWKKNVTHLWGVRQQRTEAVGLTDHPTVHVIVTRQPQVSVTASEDGTQEERDGYAFRTHLGLPSGGSHGCFQS